MPSKRTSRMPATASPLPMSENLINHLGNHHSSVMKSRRRIASQRVNSSLHAKQQLKKLPSERNLLSSEPRNPSNLKSPAKTPDRDLVQLLRGPPAPRSSSSWSRTGRRSWKSCLPTCLTVMARIWRPPKFRQSHWKAVPSTVHNSADTKSRICCTAQWCPWQ